MKRLFILFLLLITLPLQAGSLRNLFSDPVDEQDEILDPDQAFVYSVQSVSADRIVLEWMIEEGYYLYRDRFDFKLRSESNAVQVIDVKFPQGKIKNDPAFGEVETYFHDVEIELVLNNTLTKASEATLDLSYQGCKEDSVCYPPIEKQSLVQIPAVIESVEPDSNINTSLSEQDDITADLSNKSFISNVLLFFGFGVLLSLTPCVFPMIPILSGIIVGQSQKESLSRSTGFLLSLCYVLAMALTYAVLGVLAGSLDLNLQAASQNAWVISGFSLVFVLLALSMFGYYELQLPAAWQTKLNEVGQSRQSGSLLGAVIMGVLSAIIVGPCVAPPLAGALLYISQTGDAFLGGAALFAMGLGFGVPLMIIGTSAGTLLPRAGMWMETIKSVFGVIMLGVAVWFLERVLPSFYALLLWALLFICTSVYMGALDAVDGSKAYRRLIKGLGVFLLLYGLLLMLGAVSGGKTVLKPLPDTMWSANGAVVAEAGLEFQRIKSIADLDEALRVAEAQGQYVMLDFYADWCVACHELEDYTFNQAAVRDALEGVVLLQADVTANDETDKTLLKKFKIFGPPAILFFKPGEEEMKSLRLIGFIEAEAFIAHLQSVFNT